MISTQNVVKLFLIGAILTTITNFPSGFTNSSINTAVVELKRFLNESYASRGWNLDETGFSFIQSTILNCWFFSQVIGSVLAPILTDLYGRKIAYIIATITMALAGVLQYLSTLSMLPELLIAGRSLCALCSPLSDAALVLYLQECTPLEMRGAFSFLCEIGYALMCVVGMILGMRSVLGYSLPRLLGSAVFPQIAFVIFLLFIPDTPKFLMIIKNDRAAALKSLEFFQGKKEENEGILDEYLREGGEERSQRRSSLKELLCTWHLRQAVILACMVLVLTLSFYPLLQSSTFFFQKMEIPRNIAEMASTLMMTTFMFSSIIGSFIIDRFPRRNLIVFSGVTANIALSLFVVCSSVVDWAWWVKYASLIFVGGFCVTFGMVLGPTSWFVGPELVPQRHRSSVFCFCYAFNNILITVTNFATIPLYQYIGAYTFVPLFIIPSFFCIFYLYLYLPETKGRETHEIVESLRRKKKVPDLDVYSDIIVPGLTKY
ncbi:hypothetical protein AB6A40_004441 [Gnathostoma spinigerum]|uniref:Major facilitator superfamily (MFS) profile domain-containing protein n=1 Tax=Gnathostoma spinigerum TaxID=75299 RepID=A0ABD6ELY8_9BILA